MTPTYKANLIINKLKREKYDELCALGQIYSDQLYFVQDENLDAFNGKLTNVDTPENYTDGANKGYVDDNFIKKTESSYYINVDTTRIFSTLSSPYVQGVECLDYNGYIRRKPDDETMLTLPWEIVGKSSNISTDITITWSTDGTPGYVFNFNGLHIKDNNSSKYTDQTSINQDGYYAKASKIQNWPIIDKFMLSSEMSCYLSSYLKKSELSNYLKIVDEEPTEEE